MNCSTNNISELYILKNFAVDYKDYDAIIGYRADDSFFSFAQDFINGTISYRQLNNAMHLGKLGQQFVLKSKKAFDRIRFIGAEVAEREEWYTKQQSRDQKARRKYCGVDVHPVPGVEAPFYRCYEGGSIRITSASHWTEQTEYMIPN